MSAFEIAKGYSKPLLYEQSPYPISQDLVNDSEKIIDKRTFYLIMQSKAISDPTVKPGDKVHVYIKKEQDKYVKWTSPRIVLNIDKSACTVTILGASGHQIVAAFEDKRSAISDDALEYSIVESMDIIDLEISDALMKDEERSAIRN